MSENKVKLLSREAILTAQDSNFEIVDVPEWGGSVRIMGLTASQRDQFEGSILNKDQKTFNHENFRAKLVARCIVDEEGKLLFEAADIEVLGTKSASALDRVFAVAQRLSGLTKKDVEELAKN